MDADRVVSRHVHVGGPRQNRRMNSLAIALHEVGDAAAMVAGDALGERVVAGCRDNELLEVLAAAARLARAAEAILIEAAAEVDERSHDPIRSERMTSRHGCRSVAELLARTTRLSQRRAGDLVAAGRAIRQPVAPASGEVLPADFPCVRDALADGEVGVDAVLAIAGPLRGWPGGRTGVLAADEELAAAARGDGADAAPPGSADDLRALATVWAVYLDQDGAEPREARAMRKRGLTLGVCREGIVPVRGSLLAEVAGQLQLLIDSVLNPKVEGAVPSFRESEDRGLESPPATQADDRSRPQKQHDALATILSVAAASGGMPQLGGTAPILVVSVRAEDLATGSGFAHIDGIDEPVSLSVARHVACSGSTQRVVLDDAGRIVRLGTEDRVFNHRQRRAINLRDGGCVIPGCHVPAAWCEIHHVEEHGGGGPTHTDNGVALCWHHHRTLDTSGWRIRMNRGVPEVRGPCWWDSKMRWRPVTKSPTRMLDRISRRT
jgi:hypothetical protein